MEFADDADGYIDCSDEKGNITRRPVRWAPDYNHSVHVETDAGHVLCSGNPPCHLTTTKIWQRVTCEECLQMIRPYSQGWKVRPEEMLT